MKIRVLLVSVAIFLFSVTASAQTSRGTVTGTVTDPNGAVIAGAEVTLISVQTKLSRTTTSNSEGIYRLEAVDSGTYSVKITAVGFGDVEQTGIEVRANQTSDVPAQLTLSGTRAVVDVTTDA